MEELSEIHVLSNFQPYLRLITAYNTNNFRQTDLLNISRSIFYAFGATVIIVSIPTFIALIIWHLIENEMDLKVFVTVLPPLFSLFRMVLTFVAMLFKNHIISETIQRIENMVLRSEFLLYSVRPLVKRRLLELKAHIYFADSFHLK